MSMKVKILVYGNAGVGKTRLAATAPNPVIISVEGGLLSLRKEKKLPIITVENMDGLRKAFLDVSSSNYETVCLDSLSEIAEVVLEDAKKNNKDPRKAYSDLADTMTALIRKFRNLDKNIYVTCKIERAQDIDGRLVYMPSCPGQKVAQSLPYFFDEVLVMHTIKTDAGVKRVLQTEGDDHYIAKDRSGALDPFEEPDLSNIIKKILADCEEED